MKTFKQFLEEGNPNVIQTFRKSGHKLEKGGYKDKDDPSPSNMLNYGWIIKKAKGDVKQKDYDKLQQKYKDEYFNSPQINPQTLDPFKKIKA